MSAPRTAIEERIDRLLSQMTLEEKVGQLVQKPLIRNRSELEEDIRAGRVGAVVLAYTPFAGSEARQDQTRWRRELYRISVEESRLKIPVLLGRDVIHGHRTVFPVPLAQAAAWDPTLVEEAAAIAAEEALTDGIAWTFAPMADVSREPRWGRGMEGYGEDPYLSSRNAESAVSGFQRSGRFSACVKHFLGYGATEAGRDYSGADISPAALYNVYLPAYAAAVRAGVDTVMASFNDVNGEPVTGSRAYLSELLKRRLGFDGLVVSDWNAIAQLVDQGVASSRREAARIAFEAGVDMDMCSGCYEEHLAGLVRDGTCSSSRLDDAVRRVLRVKLKRCSPPAITGAGGGLARRTAFDLAAKSLVLLKNAGGILPLSDGDSIAVIGSGAVQKRLHLGSWTLDGRGQNVVSIAEAMAARRSVLLCGTDDPAQAAAVAGKAGKAVVVLYEPWNETGEARGRAELALTDAQLRLIAEVAHACPRVTAVVCAGRPLCLTRLEPYAQAILYAWHGGIEAGNAIASVLCGETNPSGKLPVTLPRSTGQLPLYYNHRPAARSIDSYYGEGAIKSYQDQQAAPLYPFGHGLSYTQFQYGQVTAEITQRDGRPAILLRCVVRNVGDRRGEEIAQCYIQGRGLACVRPVRELKGFQRVSLEQGEMRELVFVLTEQDLAYLDTGGEALYGGSFTAWIGGSCLAANAVTFTCSYSH